MEKIKKPGNRMIKVSQGVVGPIDARPKTLKVKKIGDYPGVSEAYLDVCKLYGPGLMGPPLCDELVALISHMFTEEEASVVRHMKPFSMLPAEKLASAENRPVEEVREILDRLANDKHILISFGPRGAKSYLILPIVPGTFEIVLVRQSMDTLTPWHRRFAELFEALYETGFMVREDVKGHAGIRYLPVGSIVEAHPMALPTDHLEDIIDRYKTFAVGLCQCRMTEDIVGRGCGRPMNNCSSMGPLAEMSIKSGQMRKVEKKELMEIKREAEASGLVNWSMPEMAGSNTVCSCCGCCCHAMRMISEFNMPGTIAPPHFMPEVDLDKCDYCAKCAKACPMGALTIDLKGKTRAFESVRCVGCGQCLVACDKKQAISLEPVPGYEPPSKTGNIFGMLRSR